jgi:hypothetical protein
MIGVGMHDGPTNVGPVVIDLVSWFKDCFIDTSLAGLATDPMVFFDNTNITNPGAGAPKVVFEVQGAGGNGAGMLQRMAKGTSSTVRAFY